MCYLCRNLIYIIRFTNSREVDKRYRGSVCWMSVQPQIKLRGRQIDLCVANCSNSSHTNYARIFDVIISMLFHSHTDCKKRKATWTRNKTFSRVMQLIKIIFLQWHANTLTLGLYRLDWTGKVRISMCLPPHFCIALYWLLYIDDMDEVVLFVHPQWLCLCLPLFSRQLLFPTNRISIEDHN